MTQSSQSESWVLNVLGMRTVEVLGVRWESWSPEVDLYKEPW